MASQSPVGTACGKSACAGLQGDMQPGLFGTATPCGDDGPVSWPTRGWSGCPMGGLEPEERSRPSGPSSGSGYWQQGTSLSE